MCEVVLVTYVVDAVTVMCEQLFVWHVNMLGECEGAKMTEMLVWEMGGGRMECAA